MNRSLVAAAPCRILRGVAGLVRALPLALLLLTVPALAAAAAPEAAAPPPKLEGVAPAAAGAAEPVTLFDIVGDLGRAAGMRREIEATLRETSDSLALAAKLDGPLLAPELEGVMAARDVRTRTRYLELLAIDMQIRERHREIGETTVALGGLARRLAADLERLDREVALWPQRAKLAREREAPPDVVAAVDAVGPDLAALRERLRARRDPFLIAYQRAVLLQASLETLRADVAARRARLETELDATAGTPIWQPQALGLPLQELRANSDLLGLVLVDFLRHYGARLGTLFVVMTALLFLTLRRQAAAGPPSAAAPRLSPAIALCGALVIALPCVALAAPTPPIIFYRAVFMFFPLFAGVVAVGSFARSIPTTASTLMLALFLNAFLVLARTSPAVEWLLLLVQAIAFGSALVRDWRSGALARFLPRWPALLLRRLVGLAVGMLAIAIAAGFVGHSSAAAGLVALVVIAPAYALAFAALGWALERTFASLLATPVARCMRSVRDQGDTILSTLHWVAVLIAWSIGGFLFMLPYASLDHALRIAAFLASAGLTVGEVTISLKAIVLALVVIAATWLVTKLVRFVLDHEILPRLDLRTGVPIAISTIVGYVLVVTGFVLTMAALGIDLTKVTLLAGAVGVGVGLGLQNIVNNFASGLILMIERPVNVGDQIDVGGVVGEVRRIGVRSSTIRTAQGAEIIVPNSDLAGKQVTNWTLSDRARRYEIDVGVAYGSDPARILRLLEAAAAEVPEVQRVPPPRALFVGFGDSSLDFRLFAWVESIDVGVEAQNGLRTSILRMLGEAGIEIPFPQRDVHIRVAPGVDASVVRAPDVPAGGSARA